MKLELACFTIPTDAPESDGTLDWDSTTVVVVEAVADGRRGLGGRLVKSAPTPRTVSVVASIVALLVGAPHPHGILPCQPVAPSVEASHARV